MLAGVITKANSREECWNFACSLPYGLRVEQVQEAVDSTYGFLHAVNTTLADNELGLFEDIVLGNTFSGLLSEVSVKNIAKYSSALIRNRYVGGHPDLIPSGHAGGDSQLKCDEGIEVKTSRQPGGWQGHNPEAGWLIVFRYELARSEDRPTKFVQILIARLELEDWSLAERGEKSRRTRTCSINHQGVHKLRTNPIYQEPEYIVGRNAALRREYELLHARFRRV